jgi:CRISPR-associated endonuclease/helicase Cas3
MNPLLAHKDQTLISHLEGVSLQAECFAAAFDASEQGKIAGLLHDLGKAEPEFQKRIRSDDKEGEKQPHAHHGAAYALRTCDPAQWLVALAVNGHHAGLHNRGDVDQAAEKNSEKAKACLQKIREAHSGFDVPPLHGMLPEWLKGLEFFPGNKGDGWLATELFTRFLFSALVDADRLDTEENADDGDKKKLARRWEPFNAKSLFDRLENELDGRARKAKAEGKASEEVMSVRQEVGSFCRDAALKDRGLFSLTVPTGGGKTLASLLFALHHADHHNKSAKENKRFRRIIIVIPFLSIIQQTAKEFRDLFEFDEANKGRVILEHHSQVEDEPVPTAKNKDRENSEASYDSTSERRRLAAENWDAPIIVTTSVQFFESLFSRRPAKARKLHNIAQSIIIFDEIQTLPPLMLQPILNALSELANPARPYGCSMVFCTATQPALGKSEDLPVGLEGVRSIVPQEKARQHFELLKRVKYQWPDEGESISWEELADTVLLQDVQQTLIVVNTRKAARDLHQAFREKLGSDSDGLFHLSTWMMPAHRLEVLGEVKRRLDRENQKQGRGRCILVSTQCIEAGVDVDFPKVWRAFGPYDSIVQAAGRCNRNGLIKDREDAIVHIFHPKDSKPPKGLYSTAIAQTELLRRMGLAVPENPDSFTDYFRLLYQLSVPDECGIQRARSRLHFKEVDEMFEFIEQNSISVLIRNQYIGDDFIKTLGGECYEEAQNRQTGKGKNSGYFTREDWRKIQPNIINLPFHCLKNNDVMGKLEKAFNDEAAGLYVWRGAYRGGLQGTGIDFEGPMPVEEFLI